MHIRYTAREACEVLRVQELQEVVGSVVDHCLVRISHKNSGAVKGGGWGVRHFASTKLGNG